MRKKRIFIGIPCYSQVAPQTLEDYMCFAFALGRRYTDYEFYMGVKSKSEQFRARNGLVEAALNVGADYLLMLDDDHIINTEGETGVAGEGFAGYDFLQRLLDHDVDIVGPIYYHRGGTCSPVVMNDDDGHYKYLEDAELTGGLQEVAVQGGGCMLINMRVFDQLESPWFEPEFEYGTDIQLCRNARKHGFKVYTDSSLELGHVMDQRVIITSKNKEQYRAQTSDQMTSTIMSGWQAESVLYAYKADAIEYLDIKGTAPEVQLQTMYDSYWIQSIPSQDQFGIGTKEYYQNLGPAMIARQVMYHHTEFPKAFMSFVLQSLRDGADRIGIDFGCGSAPIGFELCKRGHTLHFIDIDGAPAFEFAKWRMEKYGVKGAIFQEWPEPNTADYAILADSIEHVEKWREALDKIATSLKRGGAIFTNFFALTDDKNPEHIFMDRGEFSAHLINLGFRPVTSYIWQKNAEA